MKPGYNFAHVTTAELSWHVQNFKLLWSLFKLKRHLFFTRFWCWAHTHLMDESLALLYTLYTVYVDFS